MKIKERIKNLNLDIVAAFCVYLIIFLFILSAKLYADEILYKFKSPSFSGISTSSHYLTIENQEKSRRGKIADDLESAIAAAERDAEGTTQAKFLRNLESRIYAQISKQLVDKMFGTEEVDASLEGFFDLMGNSISYEVCTGCGVDGVDVIRISITSEDGTITSLDVPIGSGLF